MVDLTERLSQSSVTDHDINVSRPSGLNRDLPQSTQKRSNSDNPNSPVIPAKRISRARDDENVIDEFKIYKRNIGSIYT